jgi:fatty acid-binding protein DegV
MTYDGPDRRHDSGSLVGMVARIDERTKAMKETMDTLATKERVESLETALASHLDDHEAHDSARQWKIGTVVATLLGLGGIGVSIFRK